MIQMFEIAEDDWGRLVELSKRARNTPVIFTPAPGQKIEEVRSWADYAYDSVEDWWRHMGEKYGFVWDTARPHDEVNRQILADPKP